MIHAFFDIGTNSVLCLAVELSGGRGRVLFDEARVTGLGRGLSARGLHPDSCARTYEALASLRSRLPPAPELTIHAVGTSALRDAADGPAFSRRLREELGIDAQIISGEREAQLTLAAVRLSFPHLVPVLVIDVGGGSTEFVLGDGCGIEGEVSLQLGSVRMTEGWVRGDPPTAESLAALRAAIDERLRELPDFPRRVHGVGSGATATTLVAWRDQIEPWDPARVHGQTLLRSDIERAVQLFSTLTVAERARLPGVAPARADVILAGALILERALTHLGLREITVSDRGLRWGLLANALPGVVIDG